MPNIHYPRRDKLFKHKLGLDTTTSLTSIKFAYMNSHRRRARRASGVRHERPRLLLLELDALTRQRDPVAAVSISEPTPGVSGYNGERK